MTVQELLEELHEYSPALDVFIQWDDTREPVASLTAEIRRGRLYINGVSVIEL